MKIEIWSDVVCPWCYIGKRRLEAALEKFDEDVELVFRSFELNPNAEHSSELSLKELLAKKYRVSVEQAASMMENVRQAGADEGLEFHWDSAQTGNTLDAHRLIHHARTEGKGPQMKERLMRAYFTEGRLISDPAQLAECAAELGFDADEIKSILKSDQYTADVRAEQNLAQEMGVTGVPFFLLDGQYAVPGAQPADTMLMVLNQVKEKMAQDVGAGVSCDVEGECS